MVSFYRLDGQEVSLYTTSGVKVFGPKGKPSAPIVDTASLTTFRQVTNNTGYHRTITSVSGGGSAVIRELDVRSPANKLVLQWTAVFSSGGKQVTEPTVIKRAGFYVNGNYHPALFEGAQGATVAPGTYRRTDPTREDLVVSAEDTIHAIVEVSSGPIGNGTLIAERSVQSTTPAPWAGTILPMSSNSISSGLTGVYGMTVADESERSTSMVALGDSFMDRGWAHFGAERNGLAWSDWSIWLDTTHISRDPSVDKALLDRVPPTGPIPYDVAFIGWGGNDRSTDLDGWMRKSIASWRFFESLGCRIATKTLHPYTNSTDQWASVEGQTLKAPTVEPARVERNNWLRDGAPIDGADNPLPTGTTETGAVRFGDTKHPVKYPVFDEADTCETERNSGLWKFDGGQWTSDGAHLTVYGNSRMADAFTKWVADNLT